VERRRFGAATLVAAAWGRAGMRPKAGPRRKPAEGSDHGRTGEWTGYVIARTLLAGCRPPPAVPRHSDSPCAKGAGTATGSTGGGGRCYAVGASSPGRSSACPTPSSPVDAAGDLVPPWGVVVFVDGTAGASVLPRRQQVQVLVREKRGAGQGGSGGRDGPLNGSPDGRRGRWYRWQAACQLPRSLYPFPGCPSRAGPAGKFCAVFRPRTEPGKFADSPVNGTSASVARRMSGSGAARSRIPRLSRPIPRLSRPGRRLAESVALQP
jgi:hypothetical protein